VFLINLPLGLIAVLLTLRLESRSSRDQPWSFDTMGLALFVAFIAPVLFALEQAQRMSASALPVFILLMGVGIAALLALIFREKRAIYPLLPIHLLRQPTIWRSDALAACHGATLVALITFLPIYLRVLRGASASETGLLLLPMMFGIGAGSMLTGRVVSRTGLTMIFPAVGLIAATICLALLGLFAGHLGTRQLGVYLFVSGLFMGTVMGVVQVTVQNAAGSGSLGSAAASVQLSRSIGAAVGTALVGTVLFATVALSDPEAARLFGTLVQQGPATLADLPAGRQAMILSEVTVAFRNAFLTIAAFAGVGALLAWTIPARRLS
jgi:MFS family permease